MQYATATGHRHANVPKNLSLLFHDGEVIYYTGVSTRIRFPSDEQKFHNQEELNDFVVRKTSIAQRRKIQVFRSFASDVFIVFSRQFSANELLPQPIMERCTRFYAFSSSLSSCTEIHLVVEHLLY